METKEYVTLQVERTRGQQRATAFIQIGTNSLALKGKSLYEFLSDLEETSKKPLELIDVTADEDDEILPGDIVSVENAFATEEGMLWDGTDIRFVTASGAVVSPDQYAYLQNQPLGATRMFVETTSPALSIKSVWRKLARTAREARVDKAKDILYLTFGTLSWNINQGKKAEKTVKSPLLLLPVREETTSSGVHKLKITQPILKQNRVLCREIIKMSGVDIYDGCAEDISLKEIGTAIERIAQNVREYVGNMQVDSTAFHVCILDSHDESICQMVEKNKEAIASASLTRILSGEISACETKYNADEKNVTIFPLPADESQKQVLEAVISEHKSVFASAPAGAGKSQTSVNLAANFAMRGKSVCIMSEKLAANEVFLEYAAKIGLDKYCLSISGNMKTSDIVRQIKTIAKIKRQYVHTTRAKETVKRYVDATLEYERLSSTLYRTDSKLGTSLYELISIAVSAPEVPLPLLGFQKSNYSVLREALLDINANCFQIMTDEEFNQYFYHDICVDAELLTMLTRHLEKLHTVGLALTDVIRENMLNRSNTVQCVLANIARKLAIDIIGEKDLYEIGNRKVKAVYKNLVDMHLQMQELYRSCLHQELSFRVEDNIDDQFISALEKLKVTKVTPQELFSLYGKDILAICPVVVTTPTAAANYIYGTGLDDFHAMIVDEASQMQIISILPYLPKLSQLIVFGDAMQLGITEKFMKKDLVVPQGNEARDSALTDRSVLQAVQGRFPSYSLKYHYRSGTEMLIHVSNKTCYDGLLEIVPDVYTAREALPEYLGLEVIKVDPPDFDKKGGNINEALAIATRVKELLRSYPDKSIGIITFNEKQQELISDLLDEHIPDWEANEDVWVRSLENAQGKEADFVFISIGHFRRNKDESLYQGISELNRVGGENRLNVLFTRARCKNFIVMSFDYHELKKLENVGIARLYEYIHYATNGKLNELNASKKHDVDRELICCVSRMLESIEPTCKTASRLGSENLAVDIAVKRKGNSRYSLGVLMPSSAQTPQEAVTKMLVLERKDWKISPVSPIWFLTEEEKFRTQIARDIQCPISFSSQKSICFDTSREPDILFSMDELRLYNLDDYIGDVTPITEDDFLAIDFKSCYASTTNLDFWQKHSEELTAMAKNGSTEAKLILLVKMSGRFLQEGNKRALLSNVSRLYSVQNERRACFLLAHLLRVDDNGNNKKLIENLLKEAFELGIGGE